MANSIVKFYSINSTTYNNNLDKLDQNALYFVNDDGSNSFSIHKGAKALCATQVFSVNAEADYTLADLLPTVTGIDKAKVGDYLIVNVGSIQHLYAKMPSSWFDLTGSLKTEITEISAKLDIVKADVSSLTSDLSALTSDVASVETRVDTLEDKVETIASATRFAGVYDPENIPTAADFVDPSKGYNGREGDIIVSGGKEYILVVDTPASGTEGEEGYVPPTYRWEELGDVTAEASAITQLQSDVTAIQSDVTDLQEISHTHDNKTLLDAIDAARVASWDAKLNVSALRWNGEAEIEAGEVTITGASGNTLADVKAAASAGNANVSLTFNDSIYGAEGIRIENSGSTVDFNLNGNVLEVIHSVGSPSTPNQAIQLLKDNTITLKGGTLISATGKRVIQNYSDLTLEDIIVDARNCPVEGTEAVSNCHGQIHFKAGTIIIAQDETKNAFDCYFWPSHKTAGVATYADGCKILVDEGVEIIGNIGFDADNTGKADEAWLDKANIYIPASYVAKWSDKLPSGFEWIPCEDGDTWNGSAVPANYYKVGKVNLG